MQSDQMDWIKREDGSYWSHVEVRGSSGIIALVRTSTGTFECVAIFELLTVSEARTVDEAKERAQSWIDAPDSGASTV